MALAGFVSGIVVSILPEYFRDNTGLREYIITGEANPILSGDRICGSVYPHPNSIWFWRTGGIICSQSDFRFLFRTYGWGVRVSVCWEWVLLLPML